MSVSMLYRIWFSPAPFFISVLFLLLTIMPQDASAQSVTEQAAAELDISNPQHVEQLRVAAKAEIQRIPPATAVKGKPAPDNRLKTALERRLVLLDEADTLRAAGEKMAGIRTRLPERMQAAEAALKNLPHAATLPDGLDQDAYDALEQTLSEAQRELEAKQSAQVEQQRRIEVELPKLIEQATRREEEASERKNQLATLAVESGNALERRILEVQIENAGFSAAVARRAAETAQFGDFAGTGARTGALAGT